MRLIGVQAPLCPKMGVYGINVLEFDFCKLLGSVFDKMLSFSEN